VGSQPVWECIMPRLIANDVCRKLWARRRAAGVVNDHYDRMSLQRVNVETSATSSVFSAVRPSPTSAAASARPAANPAAMT